MSDKSIKGSQTEQNLFKAFTGESHARNKYTYFASVAKKEGYEYIASVFLETADNEKEHAKIFYKLLESDEIEINTKYSSKKISTTVDNLRQAVSGEHEEYATLYPEFAKIAEQEGFNKIATTFKLISKIEAEHEKYYSILLQKLETDTLFKANAKVRWKCRNCGYIHEGTQALENCPACLHSKAYFEQKQE